ncbi:bacteriophage Gp15 family protein [Mediterraneibacter agrestimuris]|uniref:bacteriophage Gp15 family protein n=1 Tax=Mediterraneibacter agrestimuris TaxID=2941333 RepID=UPI00203D2D5C|nr:bacteriophage Gp15 family protein [Mediterraneibacter agrestimuris]
MSILTNHFPETVLVDGAEYLINSDFRTVLRCFEIQGVKEVISPDELVKMVQMFYQSKEFVITEKHIDQMFWFFSCGKGKEKKRFPRKIAGINNNQPFDFEEDAELIYAGFMQQYGIDLQEVNMHWWKFMILLENLGTGTRLQKVMEYRTIDTGNDELSKKEKDFYKAMQRYYSLDRKPEKSEKIRQIEEALLNGGDVSRLLEGD